MSNSDVVTRSPQKILGDLSNNSSSMHSKENADDLKTETNAMSTSLPMESPMKGDPNAERTFEEIRQAIDPALLAKICETVHHDKSNHTLEDEVEEVVEEVLTQFHPKEVVLFKYQGQPNVGAVDFSEKRGALRFYHMKVDGKKYPNKLDGSTMKRKFTPNEKDVRTIIENVTEKEPGKPWQVKAEFREEFGIKDKFASIFCSTPKAKKCLPTTTDREQENEESSTDDEVIPLEDRRLSGLAPTSAKVRKVIRAEKPEKKEKKEKKVKEPKEKKPPKESKEKKEKKEKKAKNGTGLKKFVTSSPAGSNTGSPFLTPMKRGEKRFNAAVEKLTDSWKKRDYSAFLIAATSGAKVLNNTQIEAIPNECHRFAVRRVFNKEKDKETMKKLSKDGKKDFRDRMANERKAMYKTMDAKIKNYFSGKQEEDDLCIDASELSCPGRAVDTSSERGQLFADCFMITQFIRSLRQFIDGEENVSAENLLAGLHESRPGYMKHTVKVLISLLNTLIQDEEYKMYTHFDARLNEFSVQDVNASEVLRALLIGKTKKDEAKKVLAMGKKEEEECDEPEEKDEDGQEQEDEESKDDLNMSQHDVEEQKSIMDQFTADKEMWQLPPDVQLALLRNLVSRILELSSCNDFLSEDSSSEEAKNMKQRIVKIRKQVEDWEKEIASLPQFDESVDESQLSRTQTRERGEVAKKRENFEKKIEDTNDKIEELVEKVEMEKIKQAESKRFAPFGMDRHFRRYYWIHQKTSDAGIWIQDFGVTPYENYVRECVTKGLPINRETEIAETNAEGENGTASEANGATCQHENTYEHEKWFHIDNADSLAIFIDSLKNGPRERVLKKFLTTNLEAIQRSIRLGSRENTQSPDPEEKEEEDEDEEKMQNGTEAEASTSTDPIDDLKATVVQLASDLRDGYLTTIDLPAFEAKIVSTDKLKTIKEGIVELVDSINANNIIVKLDMKGMAIGSGAKSWFVMDKWKVRLSTAANASAVHLLLSFLDSRINWKNSVTEKRCSCCGSKRSPDCKIACDDCGLIVHYYCTRPKLQEKPTGAWSCAACSRQTVLKERRAAAVKKVQYVDESSEDEEDDDEEEKEEGDDGDNYDEEGTESDDDAFAAKNKNRGRKRVLIESDYEDDDEGSEPAPTAKKSKNAALEEVYVVMEKIKTANRMYRCLQQVPVPRGTRKCAGVDIAQIEKKLDKYATYDDFVSDLHKFFTAAKEYFENHNERKLEEFEELVISLDLPETKK